MSRFAALHADAAANGYVDLRDPAARYGLPKSTAVRYLRAGGWEPYLPAFWTPPGASLGLLPRCEIVHDHFGGRVIFTGEAGLFVQGVLHDEPDTIRALRPRSGWGAAPAGLSFHAAPDLKAIRTLPWPGHPHLLITWTTRSVAEYARVAGFKELCQTIARAHALRLLTLDKVGEELAARLRFPGRATLARAHGALSGELNHSDGERRARAKLRRGGIAVPHQPGLVLHQGRKIAEVDIPFFDVRYGVEVDGPHHLLAHVAKQDRIRDRQLAAIGWQIDRWLWFEIEERPDAFVREVRARLQALRTAR